jgi:ATP-binding cassette subfamily F protein 3
MIAGALPLQSGRPDEPRPAASRSAGSISIRSRRSTRPTRRWRSSAAPLPDDSESSRRSRLAQFGLSFDKQETTVANLSGGERARLLLNLVAMAAPHLLILDEPTNHLDIDSRRALLDALNDYEGAVILITHDRSLIELVADRLWLAADGHDIKPFDGDMDDYAKLRADRAEKTPTRSID